MATSRSRSGSSAPHRGSRRWDIALYGASGFVGRQTVAYLARHAPDVRLVLAGRDAARLQAVAAAAGLSDAAVVVADAHDATALSALARQVHVVLSSAGPYSIFGSALVAACVDARTHYCDITGETTWVRELIDRHHEQAAATGARIVPFCGFDSVPADIGTWLLTREALARLGEPCVQVKAAYSMKGGFNGGTVATMLHIARTDTARRFHEPFLLNPVDSVPADVGTHQDPFAPHHDADFRAWVGPFVMGPINTRVVRRSAALAQARGDAGYGPGFRYQEFMRFGRGPAAAVAAAGFSAGLMGGLGLVNHAPGRRLAETLMPAPGEGPSEAQMDGGFFRCDLVAHTASGHELRARVADQGDPGNRATTKFVCESALALLQGPVDGPAGVMTPASALGDELVRRLRAAGMTVELRDA